MRKYYGLPMNFPEQASAHLPPGYKFVFGKDTVTLRGLVTSITGRFRLEPPARIVFTVVAAGTAAAATAEPPGRVRRPVIHEPAADALVVAVRRAEPEHDGDVAVGARGTAREARRRGQRDGLRRGCGQGRR